MTRTRFDRLTTWLLAVAAGLALLAFLSALARSEERSPPAAAGPAARPTREVAARQRRLVREGNLHYRARRFGPALEQYARAHGLGATPNLAFNLAQCHRKLGQPREAIRFYEEYLRLAPAARDRNRITDLVDRLKAELPPPEKPPLQSVVTVPASAGPPTAAPVLPAVPSTGAPPLVVAGAAGPEAGTASAPRWYRRWYVWTLVGVAVAGGVVAAVVTTRAGGPSPPATRFGNMTLIFP